MPLRVPSFPAAAVLLCLMAAASDVNSADSQLQLTLRYRSTGLAFENEHHLFVLQR